MTTLDFYPVREADRKAKHYFLKEENGTFSVFVVSKRSTNEGILYAAINIANGGTWSGWWLTIEKATKDLTPTTDNLTIKVHES